MRFSKLGCLNCRNHGTSISIGQLGPHRQAQDFICKFLCNRKRLDRNTLTGIGRLHVRGNRVVDQRADPSLGQPFLQPVAIGRAENVKVPDRIGPIGNRCAKYVT